MTAPQGFREDLSIYLNWVLYAVYGLLREADALVREHRGPIIRVAGAIQRMMVARGWTPAPLLHRGMLLDPEQVKAGSISRAEQLTFVSYSESVAVARWFADPGSRMNRDLAAAHPEARGYLTTWEAIPEWIMFDHQWRDVLPLVEFAEHHPLINARELAWHLDHQREVIIRPIGRPLVVPYIHRPIDEEADVALTPPWVLRADVANVLARHGFTTAEGDR